MSPDQLARIKELLAKTDAPIPAIAERVGCCRSAVYKVNGQFRIREYSERRRRKAYGD